MNGPVKKIKSRIAPTPSGYLHAGNLFSFGLTASWMQQLGGSLLLRIDDMDAARKRPAYVKDIFDTLQFSGIQTTEGPADPIDFENNWSQLLRMDHYIKLLSKLSETGLVYACTCSRKQVLATSPNGVYPGTCAQKKIPLHAEGAAWRLRVPFNTVITFEDKAMGNISIPLDAVLGDFVVRTREAMPAYQVCSVADDEWFGITHIVRGIDLVHSTAAQLYIAQLAGYWGLASSSFLHHKLLTDDTNTKLSKSAGARSIRHWRENGINKKDTWKKIRLWANIPAGEEIEGLADVYLLDKK